MIPSIICEWKYTSAMHIFCVKKEIETELCQHGKVCTFTYNIVNYSNIWFSITESVYTYKLTGSFFVLLIRS